MMRNNASREGSVAQRNLPKPGGDGERAGFGGRGEMLLYLLYQERSIEMERREGILLDQMQR
jgi:hypothetical protein